MPLTRRHLLSACGAVGGALLLPPLPALADPVPDDWPGWLRAHREHVAVVLDDGRGGRLGHRAHERQPTASAVTAVHLAGYDLAVRRGQVDPGERVRVGDWDAYHLDLGTGGHREALRALGLRSTNGVTADDPNATVALDDLAAAVARHGDTAAADHLRDRLGEPTLRAAAIRVGWPDAPVPSFLGGWLRLVLGREVDARQYPTDPRLQLEVIGRLPDVPRTDDGQRPFASATGHGTASGLHRLVRALDRFPRALEHLEHGRTGPDDVAGTALVGGPLPGVLTAGFRVRWRDGRVGTAAVLVRELDEARSGVAGGLLELVRRALADPDALRALRVSLA